MERRSQTSDGHSGAIASFIGDSGLRLTKQEDQET